MAKSIFARYSKISTTDQWPLYFTDKLTENNAFLKSIGVFEYHHKDIYDTLLLRTYGNYNILKSALNDILVLEGHYYFPTDELFTEYKDLVYTHLPTWKLDSESEMTQYYTDNHITVNFTEVDNPDLTDYREIAYLEAESLLYW